MEKKRYYITPRATSIAFLHESQLLTASDPQSILGESHSLPTTMPSNGRMEERPVKGGWWE